MGATLITDIEDGVARAAAERPRALIVRAEGEVFSAGVDVHVFEGLDKQSADALTGRLLRLTHALEDLPAPHPRRRARTVSHRRSRALARL